MRKQLMTEHPDIPTFEINRKFGCIILAEWKKRLRNSKAIGKDLIRLSRRSMNTKRSFILIDWQPITVGNFFCSTHGYFESWFFPWDTGKCQGRDRGEVPRCANSPLVSKNYRQDSTHRWWHNDTQKWRFYILRDRSSGWMSQGSTRLKVDDFKMISRWL